MTRNPEFAEATPNVAAEIAIHCNGSEFVPDLRSAMKWMDGETFSAAHLQSAHKDVPSSSDRNPFPT